MECSICLEEIKQVDNCTTKCNHSYHLSCFVKVKNGACPICREKIFQPTETIVEVPFIVETNRRHNKLIIFGSMFLASSFFVLLMLFIKGIF